MRLRQRSEAVELLDDPATVAAHLPANLADIRRLNRLLGGVSPVRRHSARLLSTDRDNLVLDVCTGSADVPRAVARSLGRRGLRLRAVGVDVSGVVLQDARGEDPHFPLVQADGLRLPFPAGAFDLVTCCLALHHFQPEQARLLLRELWRVTQSRLLVVDLARGHVAYAGAWLATRTIAHSHVTRHDGPISVLRAYTSLEAADLARQAGLPNVTTRGELFSRWSLIAHA